MTEPPRAPASVEQRVFWVSWLSYFSYYFTRSNFSVAKKPMQQELGLTKDQLNYIDLASLSAYCVGQFVHGALGDVLGPRRLVTLGMLASAALSVAFGLNSIISIFILLWALNGFVQATGWPGNGKLMASWFSARERGEKMGVWSTCYQAGGVAAKLLATALLVWGWRAALLGPALWVTVVALTFWLAVRDRPSELGYANPEIDAKLTDAQLHELRRAAWPVVLKNARVWCLGTTYFFMKMMRYAFIYWLPFYLYEAYHFDAAKAGYVSIAFDAGGIPLVVFAGFMADRLLGRRRIATAAFWCLALCGALGLYRVIGDEGLVWNIVGLSLIGGTLFAADSLVSGAASQDLGGPHAAALACGLVNGIGSIGGIVQGFFTVWISTEYGWDAMFQVFMLFAFLSALPLLPFLRVRPHST
ncbi:MAG: MFS transporter [Kofleriaceae bacterium]|nr:MAG: MFS transporter [Kofleriaceae bacterium]MBZ0236906.1 MFS transporter [Kofleriaceae bacterium]